MSQTYDLLVYHSQTQIPNKGKYFGYSVFIHTALAIACLFVIAPQLMPEPPKEVITIELQSSKPAPIRISSTEFARSQPAGVARKEKNSRQVTAPSALLSADTTEKITTPVKTSRLSKASSAKLKSHTSNGKSLSIRSSRSRAGIPQTLEDIAAPVLETEGMEVAQPGKLGDNEFEETFRKIDRSNIAVVSAEKSRFDEEAKRIADEKDAALNAASEQQAAEAKAMENALKLARSKNAAALANTQAVERMAADRAAADRAVAEKAGLEKVAAKEKNRGASGNTGKSTVGGGIRSLDQLQQMPGNPRPQYSVEERMNRHQGEVVFHAFINSLGRPEKFKLMQSTGFQNLDAKTLGALKRWRFYPGQEGWVELPFKWDIRGGVQELPTMLRRMGRR